MMGMSVSGAQGPVSEIVLSQKRIAEQVITSNIKEAMDNPAKTIKELQAPSPLSQFLDIKI